MPQMKTAVLLAFRHMLSPLVRLLIRSGVSWDEFAETGKEVFVEVARRDYGLQGRPTNIARVSLMTGLSRREVTRVTKIIEGQIGAHTTSPGSISRVLSAWHLDPEFTHGDGSPVLLPAGGHAPSLETLFKKYAGDMPHSALLKELLNLGLVQKSSGGYQVLSREYIRSSSDPDMLRQAGIALHDHAETVVHNVNAERAVGTRFERMATEVALSEEAVNAFREQLEEKGRDFLQEMDAWLMKEGKGYVVSGRKQKKFRAGVGMYLVLEEQSED